MFHPAVQTWFDETFDSPTPAQRRGWEAIESDDHALIAAPTGSGKTLAAFLSSIDSLVRQSLDGGLEPGIQVVYVSPLKALSYDIDRNLQEPLEGIDQVLDERGEGPAEIETFVRTGDTPQSARRSMVESPPHILATTPESLYLLLTSERGREALEDADTLIVDEIHALAENRRGSHLSITAERLDHLVEDPVQRIGLSATQRPIEEVARFLVGHDAGNDDEHGDAETAETPGQIVDCGHQRELDLQLELTESPLRTIMSHEHMEEVHERLAELIDDHTTTLVFANTRREVERVTKHLCDLLGDSAVAAHHGSLSTDRRRQSEEGLKSGRIQALVATASMELGVDVGSVDLVCQLGSVRSINTLLQRIGRSGHAVGETAKGRLFPMTRDELVESVALLAAVREGRLDRLEILEAPLDIAAQQIVAMAGSRDWETDELYDLLTATHPFRDLDRERFHELLEMLHEGFATERGRRGAYIHWDQVNGQIRGRDSARLTALTSGGAIPARADYDVVLDETGRKIGSVHEEFAIESLPGDVFQLGNKSWQIADVESTKCRLRVHDAGNQPPTLPIWFGGAPARTEELSRRVSDLRERLVEELDVDVDADDEGLPAAARDRALDWLDNSLDLDRSAAEQLVDYLGTSYLNLGAMPSRETIVAERFFDEAGNTHLVIHSPFGADVNRGWGLALRKRFCRKFNFELQAAADEDGIVLSLGPTHSFPLDDVFRFLHPDRAEEILVQATLDSALFETRWRWNANRALAVPRFWAGSEVPHYIQRMQAEDMLSLVFPDQVACLENISGDREVPDHPLVDQTLEDCLHDEYDVQALGAILEAIHDDRLETAVRDVAEPSPMAQHVLNVRPYAYLDPAPLEERRTRAIRQRGTLDVDSASELADLDPEAVDRVRDQVWPRPDDPDELHDALARGGYLTESELERGLPDRPEYDVRAHAEVPAPEDRPDDGWRALFDELADQGRATAVDTPAGRLYVATEQLPALRAILDDPQPSPPVTVPERQREDDLTSHDALVDVVRDRLQLLGPTTVPALAETLGADSGAVRRALDALEAEGTVFRGDIDPRIDVEPQWCHRRLLARVHRYTLDSLRERIEPAEPAEFVDFLFTWQGVEPAGDSDGDDRRVTGAEGLNAVVEQLTGFHAAAGAWESEILPARVEDYDPDWLDDLCLTGRAVWGRLTADGSGGHGAMRTTPVALAARGDEDHWTAPLDESPELSSEASRALEAIDEGGAVFFDDLKAEAGLLESQAERALDELIAAGLVASDGFAGLRALLIPSADRRGSREGRADASDPAYHVSDGGRWKRIERPEADREWADDELKAVAETLLDRWGVVFRKLVRREATPPWRKLLRVLQRLEARGEVRGGRFVHGFTGQQFAHSDAVSKLRAVRAREATGEFYAVSACDPLNLTGVVDDRDRVPAKPSNRLLYRDGRPVAVDRNGEQQFLADLDEDTRRRAERLLTRKPTPPEVLAYLGSHG